jgi:homoserine O-succinyltransferase/O-acetyltransferase
MPLVLARSEMSATDDPTIIDIGLLNNLSDGGLEAGDRQIIELLTAAAGTQTVRLHFFSLPSIPRGSYGRAHIGAHYTDVSDLIDSKLDGLFVTGCEPRKARLPEEAFWSELTEIIDWAEHNTRSAIWSCLAAHAAVLHLDGIERRLLPAKRSGVFHVEQTGAHPLLAGAPADLRIPHSRYNDLDETELAAAGYQIVTRGPEVGADIFLKTWRSLFIYLQGHPEYDADALRREYRRDVVRYFDGTSQTYPIIPAGIFDRAMETRLETFAAKAQRDRHPALIDAFPLDRAASSRRPRHRRDVATVLFSNWLQYLHAKTADHAA